MRGVPCARSHAPFMHDIPEQASQKKTWRSYLVLWRLMLFCARLFCALAWAAVWRCSVRSDRITRIDRSRRKCYRELNHALQNARGLAARPWLSSDGKPRDPRLG
jgi:hypothetical protein